MLELDFFMEDGFWQTMFCDQKHFLCDSATGPRRHGGHAGIG